MAKHSSLVCQHLENISLGALERHQDIIRAYVRNRQYLRPCIVESGWIELQKLT